METFNVVFICKATGIRHWWPNVTQYMINRYQSDYELMGWETMKAHVMTG